MGVVAVLLSALVPTFNSVAPKANQTVTAGNCRRIITALRLYAQDHKGKYPDADASEPMTSNDAFRVLFREGYVDDERCFGANVSRFVPDNVIGSKPSFPKALEAGENHWAMTKGLTHSSNALTPLVMENPALLGWPPRWNVDAAGKKERGRAWGGGRIIVGFKDSSVQPIKLDATKGSNVGPYTDADGKDVFTRAGDALEILDILE